MTNPFFEDWTALYGAPPLDRVAPEHFAPAYDRALAEHTAEIAAIAENSDPPSFENVVVALEKSGQLLTRVEGVFHNLAAAATNEQLQAIEMEMAPRMSAHWSAISMHPVLFARLDAVYRRRDALGLDVGIGHADVWIEARAGCCHGIGGDGIWRAGVEGRSPQSS